MATARGAAGLAWMTTVGTLAWASGIYCNAVNTELTSARPPMSFHMLRNVSLIPRFFAGPCFTSIAQWLQQAVLDGPARSQRSRLVDKIAGDVHSGWQATSHGSAFLLAEVGMQYSAIDDRVVMGPADQFGDFFGFDEPVKAVHCRNACLNIRVTAQMCA